MPRYKILIEYDGSAFCGWQAQKGVRSVQKSLSEALQSYCGCKVVFYGAGRTDAGVHALGQVAHFDLFEPRPPQQIQNALNFYLKKICVLDVKQVSDSFDARRSAKQRIYLYKIVTRSAPLVLMQQRAWHLQSVDVPLMRAAAQHFVGKQDFTTFRSAHCQAASPLKTLEKIHIHKISQEELHVFYTARSFLHTQVRSLTAALCAVGTKRWDIKDLKKALYARNRAHCPPLAPPFGLYLYQVVYDDPK